MAKVSRETFNFTQDFQDLILACVLKRPEFIKYDRVIAPKFFTGSVSTLTARAMFDYHKRRHSYPSKEVLVQIVAEEAKKSQEDGNVVHEYVNKLFKIRTLKVWEEVHKKVIDFCRERAILKALKLTIDHFKEGTVPEGGYVNLFEKAVAVGSEFTDLDLFKFDPERVIEKPEPVLRLITHTVATAGNLVTVSGLPKVGKSGVMSAMLAALVSEPDAVGDRLGFLAHNPDRKAVLHFDTEQSQFDHQNLIMVALERAGVHVGDSSPLHLHSYAVSSFRSRPAYPRYEQDAGTARIRCPVRGRRPWYR